VSDACDDICAIVVTYRADPLALAALVAAVVPQVGRLAIVANDAAPLDAGSGVTILRQAANIGLAAGFNAGIAFARDQGFDRVLLLDQDSEPAPGMVRELASALAAAGATARIGAVGPSFHDVRELHAAPFVRFGFPLNRKQRAAPGELVPADFLISSGCLVPLAVLDAVGDMDADLFIDNIDLEWSCRARAAGYGLLGVGAARMRHRLGDARRALPLGLGRVVVHGPLRLYYMMRNRVLLYRMPHVPRVWVAQDVLRVPVKFLLFSVLIGPRLRNMRCMLAGLRDGAAGRAARPPA
jgi:rhamnosyltransferase